MYYYKSMNSRDFTSPEVMFYLGCFFLFIEDHNINYSITWVFTDRVLSPHYLQLKEKTEMFGRTRLVPSLPSAPSFLPILNVKFRVKVSRRKGSSRLLYSLISSSLLETPLNGTISLYDFVGHTRVSFFGFPLSSPGHLSRKSTGSRRLKCWTTL